MILTDFCGQRKKRKLELFLHVLHLMKKLPKNENHEKYKTEGDS